METLHVLGTGHAMVTRCYNTCFALERDGQYFLVDGGGGNAILRILAKQGIALDRIEDLFLTHAHTDHLFGVIWVLRRIAEKGLRVGNVDVTVLAQRPKLRDHIPQMIQNLAADLDVPTDRVNVKATTEEGLGFTGRSEGIACHAVCLLEEA